MSSYIKMAYWCISTPWNIDLKGWQWTASTWVWTPDRMIKILHIWHFPINLIAITTAQVDFGRSLSPCPSYYNNCTNEWCLHPSNGIIMINKVCKGCYIAIVCCKVVTVWNAFLRKMMPTREPRAAPWGSHAPMLSGRGHYNHHSLLCVYIPCG